MSRPNPLKLAMVCLTMLGGCADPAAPATPSCGEARSLPVALRSALPPRTGEYMPDERWAELALAHPGGFAGVFYEQGRPVLMLSRPNEATAARTALASDLPHFPVATAEVRTARWDFAKLLDWYEYLVGALAFWENDAFVSGDKDEVLNRIVFGLRDSTAIRDIQAELKRLEVPCDLVKLEVISVPALE